MNTQEECAAVAFVAIILEKQKKDQEKSESFGLNRG